jgi:hypothetical protein
MKKIEIFPFYSLENIVVEERMSSDHTVFRGIMCEKRELDSSIEISIDGKEIKESVYYWHPITQSKDVIQEGLNLVKKGLGF